MITYCIGDWYYAVLSIGFGRDRQVFRGQAGDRGTAIMIALNRAWREHLIK
jgi:hypothetical protein